MFGPISWTAKKICSKLVINSACALSDNDYNNDENRLLEW